MDKFINPYTDFGFKKLFGAEHNADLLISFLNAVIADGDDNPDPITSLSYKNVERIGEITTMRSSYFDVFCQTQSGADFIVEMQNGKQIFFKDRSLYYATIPIQDQGKKGKAKADADALAAERKLASGHRLKTKDKKALRGWDYRLKDVYLVAVMDFEFPNNEYPPDEYLHRVKLMDVDDNHVFYDKLTLIYLEMPKLERAQLKLDTMRDKWMYALHSLYYTDEQPEVLCDEVFLKLFREAAVANLDERQLLAYRMSLKDLWDSYSTWESANQEGIETGITKGKEIGLAEGKVIGLAEGKVIGLAEGKVIGLAEGSKAKAIEVARNLKSLGMNTDTITQATGLSAEELATL